MNLTEDGNPAHGCEMCDGEDACTCPKWLPPAPGSEVVSHVDNRGGLTGPDYALVVLRNGVVLEVGDEGLNVYASREHFDSNQMSDVSSDL